MMDLSGKWKYSETYGCGKACGELLLEQHGDLLSGRIVFTDRLEGESPYMIQEFLSGSLDGRKVRLISQTYDVVEADFNLVYELDNWFGILLDERTIRGVSTDEQGIEGRFEFIKIN